MTLTEFILRVIFTMAIIYTILSFSLHGNVFGKKYAEESFKDGKEIKGRIRRIIICAVTVVVTGALLIGLFLEWGDTVKVF